MPADPPSLRIDVAAPRLVLIGDLDAETAAGLVEAADLLVEEGHRDLTIDCGELTFCDSYGLRALERVADLVEPDGSTSIVRPSPTLIRILRITGLAELFTIADNGDSELDSSVTSERGDQRVGDQRAGTSATAGPAPR